MYFTTKDNDIEKYGGKCALLYGPKEPVGGWWYKNCWPVGMAPNSIYGLQYGMYINGGWQTLSFIEIKVRPHNCNI